MKKQLHRDDFELIGSGSEIWFLYKTMTIKGIYNNWPFHKTEEARQVFLESLGIQYEAGQFPYMPTEKQALILLVTAINDFNSRQ